VANHQACDDCGNPQHAEYALKKERWLAVARIEEILCLDCLGRRMVIRYPTVRLTLPDFEFLSVGGSILIDSNPGTPGGPVDGT
jgi:hypothetical protein